MCHTWYRAYTTAFWGWCALYFEKRDNCQGRDKRAVLRCCDFLDPCGFTTGSAAVKQTCCRKFFYQGSGRRSASRCPAGDPRALFPGERHRGSCQRRPAVPGRQGGSLARGLAELGRCPVPGRPQAAATAPRPPGEAAAFVPGARRKRQTRLLWVFLRLASLGRRRPFPLSASRAHLFSPGAPEGAGRGPALPSPGRTGTGRGAGTDPPGAAAGRRSCAATISGLSLT